MSYSIVLRASIILALSIFAIVATGCGGGAPAPSPTTSPCIYNPPALPVLNLIYPMPGATGVPTDIGVLVYAGSENEAVDLEVGSTPFFSDGATIVPSPLPSPAATAGPGEQLYAVKIGALAANTKYTALWTGELPTCGGAVEAETFPFGSFTTQ
jgi:hypothetical protein